MSTKNSTRHGAASMLLLVLASLGASRSPAQEPAFTPEQAENGKNIYQEHCQICHGTTLMNGQFGTPLRGSFFRKKWAGKSLGELLRFTYDSMPPENKQGLPIEQYAEAVAYILSRNELEAGEVPLAADPDTLKSVLLPW